MRLTVEKQFSTVSVSNTGPLKCLYSMSTPSSSSSNKMTHYNPYVQNLIEMGYDEQDCRNVAAVGESNVTYPRNIHGRIFETETEYNDAVADFINGL